MSGYVFAVLNSTYFPTVYKAVSQQVRRPVLAVESHPPLAADSLSSHLKLKVNEISLVKRRPPFTKQHNRTNSKNDEKASKPIILQDNNFSNYYTLSFTIVCK